ncbi:hypothetical protein A3B51_01855 [Candidatus Curtissbacteria bacterium RIFCSPLOWO2_01_FULL_41_18]|uniref:HTH cro/C1-type domain-containing protein n=2 Tax=Candidatus Curtissiibacteriota TaxID=1752717 RepID=A0A1F5G1X6_9BACT|nr:MAG: hypothetical protein A2696_02735 [Candidatus Curtissbacteria bacterium RIFCSPHIGHO2_01_FULL_41_13]OGE03896.1 MAG: hypothetical protein A3B51_01855 [Candidatus Curtissbacteria bacterium RIFCSPLOWO2_01_FULL_41_18]
MKRDSKSLGQKIKKLRKTKGMTQVELAVAIRLSPSYISSLEQGVRQPSLKTLNRISKALGVNLKDLL